jgi:hypothetical protein
MNPFHPVSFHMTSQGNWDTSQLPGVANENMYVYKKQHERQESSLYKHRLASLCLLTSMELPSQQQA